MDSILLWLGVSSAALLLLATAVAWWEHRKHMARVRKQQLAAKDSRFALEAHSQAVDAKLLRASAAQKAQATVAAQAAAESKTTRGAAAAVERAAARVPALAASVVDRQDAAARRTSSDTATARAKPGLAAGANVAAAVLHSRAELAEMEKQPTWEDTQPMVLDTRSFEFEPTQLETHSFDFAPTQPADLSPH